MWEQVGQTLNQSTVGVLSRLASLLPGLLALLVAVLFSVVLAWLIAIVLRLVLRRIRFDERLESWGFTRLAEYAPQQSPALLRRKFRGLAVSRCVRGEFFRRRFRQLGHRFFSAGREQRPAVAAFPICGRSSTRRQRSSRARKPAKAEP